MYKYNLQLPFCSVRFYFLFQEMAVVFQFMFLVPVGYSHVQGNGPGMRVGRIGWKF